MPEPTSCARHASVETRLRCASCETPICPRCAVEAPIGLRCPDCARPAEGGGLRRRPEQVARAAGAAVLGAMVGGALVGGIRLLLPIGGLLAAYVVGLQLGRVVRSAAAGNTVDVVRGVAVAGAVAVAVVADVVVGVGRGGVIGFSTYTLLTAGIAVFGAWSAMR